jgi:hypothetical protein
MTIPNLSERGVVLAAVKHAERRLRRWPTAMLCAGHAWQSGGESPLCNLMEVKHE